MKRFENMFVSWAKSLINKAIEISEVIDNKEDVEHFSSEEHITVNTWEDNGTPHGTHYEDDIVHADNVRPSDVVLMSRSQRHLMHKHPGNLYFRTLVAESFDKYDRSSSKAEKLYLSKSIVWAIERKGGRFVKPHHVIDREVILWKRTPDVEGHWKVIRVFRSIQKQKQRVRA